MIRPEKREVESIAASCATGLERAWAENDRLQAFADQLAGEKFSDRNHAALQSRASSAEARVATLRRQYDTACIAIIVGIPAGFALGWLAGVLLP